MRGPATVQVELDLKLFKMSGTWTPNDAERLAAWELYIELVTRVAVVPLVDGFLREALSSNYAIFDRTRQILKARGPEVAETKPQGQYNFGYLAVAYLNFTLRPVLSHWHPRLEDWEQQRPSARTRLEHERAWPDAMALREDISRVNRESRTFVSLLAEACGTPDLLHAVPR